MREATKANKQKSKEVENEIEETECDQNKEIKSKFQRFFTRSLSNDLQGVQFVKILQNRNKLAKHKCENQLKINRKIHMNK